MDDKNTLVSPRRLLSGRTSGFRQIREPGNKARVAVPSFFTLMNLFCGFVAIAPRYINRSLYMHAI